MASAASLAPCFRVRYRVPVGQPYRKLPELSPDGAQRDDDPQGHSESGGECVPSRFAEREPLPLTASLDARKRAHGAIGFLRHSEMLNLLVRTQKLSRSPRDDRRCLLVPPSVFLFWPQRTSALRDVTGGGNRTRSGGTVTRHRSRVMLIGRVRWPTAAVPSWRLRLSIRPVRWLPWRPAARAGGSLTSPDIAADALREYETRVPCHGTMFSGRTDIAGSVLAFPACSVAEPKLGDDFGCRHGAVSFPQPAFHETNPL